MSKLTPALIHNAMQRVDIAEYTILGKIDSGLFAVLIGYRNGRKGVALVGFDSARGDGSVRIMNITEGSRQPARNEDAKHWAERHLGLPFPTPGPTVRIGRSNPRLRASRIADVRPEIDRLEAEIATLREKQYFYRPTKQSHYPEEDAEVWDEYEEEIQALEAKIEELRDPDTIYADANPRGSEMLHRMDTPRHLKEDAMQFVLQLEFVQALQTARDEGTVVWGRHGEKINPNKHDLEGMEAAVVEKLRSCGLRPKKKHGQYDIAALRRAVRHQM